MTQIIKNISKSEILKRLGFYFVFVSMIVFSSCEDLTLPETGSIPDTTPPSAVFSASQGAGSADEWKMYSFSNQSSSATSYAWTFGDGNSSTEFEPSNTYPGEGTYTVTLTAKDNLGVESTSSEIIEVVEPPAPATPDPVLVNTDFNKLPKSSGSDCACSAWINKSLGDQGESSSGNGSDVLKFDNNEPDHVYQEFEVTPNGDYKIEIISSFKSPSGGSFPSQLEVRVLTGSGYDGGYTPTYYTVGSDFPQDGFGYSSISQVETTANNVLTEVLSNPSDTNYLTNTFTFNVGNNTSVALFMRGIGGPATGGGGGDFGYNSGDEEIRVDSITITAVN